MKKNDQDNSDGLMNNNAFMFSMKTDEEIKEYLTNNNDENKSSIHDNLFKDQEFSSDNELKTNIQSISDSKTLYQRIFGKIDPGSIRGSIFNLAILSLGSGLLALPQKFGQMSIVVSIIDIILAGIAAYWTLNIMILASEKYKIYNYSELVNHLYGKGLSLVLDITILVYIFGVLILYQVIGILFIIIFN